MFLPSLGLDLHKSMGKMCRVICFSTLSAYLAGRCENDRLEWTRGSVQPYKHLSASFLCFQHMGGRGEGNGLWCLSEHQLSQENFRSKQLFVMYTRWGYIGNQQGQAPASLDPEEDKWYNAVHPE